MDARLKLADAYVALEEPKSAIQECRRVLAASVSNTEQKAKAHYLSGVAHLALGNAKKSLSQLLQALKLRPDTETWLALGNLRLRYKKFQVAIRCYQMAIKQNPESAEAYQRLGDVYAFMNDPNEAVEAYKHAIQLKPDSASVHNSLARYYAEQGTNLAEALELANTALAMEPKSAIFHDTLGWIYYKKGMLEKAIVELQDASFYAPDDPRINYHLGLAYSDHGDSDKAYRKLKAAIDTDTTFPEIDDAKKILQEIDQRRQ